MISMEGVGGMNDDFKIKYTFHNKDGETVDMTFTMVEIEGMVGGFINHLRKHLKENGFGEVVEVYRMLLI